MAAELLERLRLVPALHDLTEEQLAWFAAQCRLIVVEQGDAIIREGDPADTMFVLLEGEIHSRRERGAADGRVLVHRAGALTGMLPFSRLKHFPVSARAMVRSVVAGFPAAQFPELLQRIPQLGSRLVEALSDRVRETTRVDLQQEKLASLGRLAAGLAHELNNPAAAAGRAAGGLRDVLQEADLSTARLARQVEEAALQRLRAMAHTLDPAAVRRLDPLARGDREDEIASWLQAHGLEEGWRLAATLMEAGADPGWLERFAEAAPAGTLADALLWLEATLRAEELLRTVEQAALRISTLVGAVKGYTFMDRAPLQEVDVHAGLESSLQMLAHRLGGITVTREYAPELPRVRAFGGELNQLWTNLLDNAADAAGEGGRVTLWTGRRSDGVSVEVRDDGPGIAPELQTRIFEPFFTTKEVGRGTGLGLDIARRIVEQHQGTIRVESVPGDTRFVVWLPLSGAAT